MKTKNFLNKMKNYIELQEVHNNILIRQNDEENEGKIINVLDMIFKDIYNELNIKVKSQRISNMERLTTLFKEINSSHISKNYENIITLSDFQTMTEWTPNEIKMFTYLSKYDRKEYMSNYSYIKMDTPTGFDDIDKCEYIENDGVGFVLY